MDLDTKINVIRQLEAELWKLVRFSVAILNFEFFGWNHWSGVMVRTIFGISIPKKNPIKFSCFLHKVHAPFTCLIVCSTPFRGVFNLQNIYFSLALGGWGGYRHSTPPPGYDPAAGPIIINSEDADNLFMITNKNVKIAATRQKENGLNYLYYYRQIYP